jgi:ABC-type transport system substrate-binding protein
MEKGGFKAELPAGVGDFLGDPRRQWRPALTISAEQSGRRTLYDQYFAPGLRSEWRQSEFDKLIEEEQGTVDNKKRIALFNKPGKPEDVPFVPLYNLDFYAGATSFERPARRKDLQLGDENHRDGIEAVWT